MALAGHQGRRPRVRRRSSSRTRTGSQKLTDYDPDVVCYSVTTGMHLYFADDQPQGEGGRCRGVFSIFGGPHATFTPEYRRGRRHRRDLPRRGRGARSSSSSNRLQRRRATLRLRRTSASRTAKTGEIHKNPQRPLIAGHRLARLPRPRRRLRGRRRSTATRDRKVFVSQRGCPMPCTLLLPPRVEEEGLQRHATTSTSASARSTHLIDEIHDVKRSTT